MIAQVRKVCLRFWKLYIRLTGKVNLNVSWEGLSQSSDIIFAAIQC